ncbi:MAG: EscU/YscU/HrcU family type III secretion system export apparatus switch protein [Treponema sp.]|jgi:flagellar biosynthesis protein|nr:EscU/YscU/HrcU family type III secretion system export apparatus switch protein [Treponema sp.]
MDRTDRDKRKKAAAISYQAGEAAPRLIVSGQGREAELIIALARDLGIEVVEDPFLAALLDTGIKPGDFVPVWCWEALAKILAFVLEKEGR